MNNSNIRYNKLPELLHKVRWSQQLAAIIAEALMIGAFFLSGLDVAVGGVMATNGVVRWLWGVMFSVSLDSLFVISWLRVKKAGWSLHLLYTIPIALAMSMTVFLPVLVQLLQSSLVINFTTALGMLGIGLVPLVMIRALVSVILGAVLALTNTEEGQQPQPQTTVLTSQAPAHVMMQRQVQEELPANRQLAAPKDVEPSAVEQQVADRANRTNWTDTLSNQIGRGTMDNIQQNPGSSGRDIAEPGVDAANVNRTNRTYIPYSRIGRKAVDAIQQNPELSDREIARIADVAPSTVGLYRRKLSSSRSK